MFNHIPTSTPIMETAHEDNIHFYKINGVKYPSITTILHSFPNEGINQWKLRTPNWKEIQDESFKVGTALHEKIESYLKNKDHDKDMELLPMKLFYNLKPELDKIDNIRCQERYLYEPNLRVAGAVDCIAEYEDELCVIDFKNSRKEKKNWMVKKSGYYEQITAYALMAKHCSNLEINKGIILIASWDGKVNKYEINISDYTDNLISILNLYYQSLSNVRWNNDRS